MEVGTKDDSRAMWVWIRDLANAGEHIVSAEELDDRRLRWSIVVSREHTHVKITMPRDIDDAVVVEGSQEGLRQSAAASVNQVIASMRELDERSSMIYDTRIALERLHDLSDKSIVSTMREILNIAPDAK